MKLRRCGWLLIGGGLVLAFGELFFGLLETLLTNEAVGEDDVMSALAATHWYRLVGLTIAALGIFSIAAAMIKHSGETA